MLPFLTESYAYHKVSVFEKNNLFHLLSSVVSNIMTAVRKLETELYIKDEWLV